MSLKRAPLPCVFGTSRAALLLLEDWANPTAGGGAGTDGGGGTASWIRGGGGIVTAGADGLL